MVQVALHISNLLLIHIQGLLNRRPFLLRHNLHLHLLPHRNPKSHSSTKLILLPDSTIKISIPTKMAWKPGQHVFRQRYSIHILRILVHVEGGAEPTKMPHKLMGLFCFFALAEIIFDRTVMGMLRSIILSQTFLVCSSCLKW
jgi:hypothetical protein